MKKPIVVSSTTPSSELVDMNFKVPARFRQKAKMQAVARGMTGVEQVTEALEFYWRAFPVTVEIT